MASSSSPEKQFMLAAFDVTELTAVERERLASMVAVQAEQNDDPECRYPAVPDPAIGFTGDPPEPKSFNLPDAQSAEMLRVLDAVIAGDDPTQELHHVAISKTEVNDESLWQIVSSTTDHDEEVDRYYVTRIDAAGTVVENYEGH